jgi:lipoprotein-anchoring transpeptidase ErfK/SrfK
MVSKLMQTLLVLGLFSITFLYAERGKSHCYSNVNYASQCSHYKHTRGTNCVTYKRQTTCPPQYTQRGSSSCQKPICFSRDGKYKEYGRYATKAPTPFYYPHFYEDQELKQAWTACKGKAYYKKEFRRDRGTTDLETKKHRKKNVAKVVNEVVRKYDPKTKRFILEQKELNPYKTSYNHTNGSTKKLLAKIDISSQRMRVYKNGKHLYTWKVSTGKRGFATPQGTFKPQALKRKHYSKRYNNAYMPHSVFFKKNGYAIHGTNSVNKLGRRVSHGCVRLNPRHAKKLFEMIQRSGQHNTTIKITA